MSELTTQSSAQDVAIAVTTVAEAAVGGSALRRIGVDVVDLNAFARQISLGGDRFLTRLFTEDELEHCRGRLEQLASRVAAKEAAAKVLGTGFRGVRWREIEVATAPNGAPSLRLCGEAAVAALRLGLTSIEVSCSHDGQFAVAVAAGEWRDDETSSLGAREGGSKR